MGRSPRNSIRLNTTGSSYAINSSQGSLAGGNGGGAAANTTAMMGAAFNSSAVANRPRSLSVDRRNSGGGGTGGGQDMYERVSLLMGNGEPANDPSATAMDETSVP